MTYKNPKNADEAEQKMHQLLAQKGFDWELDLISDRPPLPWRRKGLQMARSFRHWAKQMDIPVSLQSSARPTVDGLGAASIPVLCGMGAVAQNLYTPQESISRIGLLQRMLMIAQYIASQGNAG